ncbi:MAG: hypothetical protein WCD53_08140 [Microcoleus sp.]
MTPIGTVECPYGDRSRGVLHKRGICCKACGEAIGLALVLYTFKTSLDDRLKY